MYIDWEKIDFKYCSVRGKIEQTGNMSIIDLIVTSNELLFLEYDPNKFKFSILKIVLLKNLRNMNLNKETNSFFIRDSLENCIEIKTESYISILTLIDELYRKYNC